jgi:hypothetical protein
LPARFLSAVGKRARVPAPHGQDKQRGLQLAAGSFFPGLPSEDQSGGVREMKQ